MAEKRFKIGSRYFFDCIPGFTPHDEDFVILEDNPTEYKIVRQIRFIKLKRCEFYWKNMSKEEFIDYTLNNDPPMQVGKFLVPEFAGAINLTIEDLKLLKPVIDRIDKRHEYEQIIFNSYIENNDFTLTDEQRQLAYNKYLENANEH